MDIILVPGFWLGANSWNDVVPVLEAAGHTTHPLTLPGLESVDADRSTITLRDHVDAVVAAIDSVSGQVALVGHSGGGPIAYGAADQRVDRVSAMVYVDTWPLADGVSVNTDYPAVDGSVPFPDWSEHDDEDVRDLDDEQRARLLAVTVPEPVRVASDGQELHDERRRAIPTTIIASSRPRSAYDEWLDHPFLAELTSLEKVTWIELPGASHWPQFTRPREVGEAIVTALSELAEK
jgi:pimeloyl-ACP methyl ester carboxylesterase